MRTRSLFPAPAALLTALALLATPAAAQTAQLEGIVIDSLRGMPLVGARVQVGEDPRSFITDATGRFRADSLPAGQQEVRFSHAVLDSLGMRSGAVLVQLRPDTLVRVTLGIPSGRTFFAKLCPAPPNAPPSDEGRSAVIGVVRATDTDAPLANATVQLQWKSLVFDETLGFRRKTQVRNATADANGLYIICDAPGGLDALLLAAAAGHDTAAAEVWLRDYAAVVHHMMLAPRDSATGRVGSATLTGVVRDERGEALEAAEVVIVNHVGATIYGPARTDASGRYVLNDAPPGTRLVEFRRVGSTPVRRGVTLGDGRETRLDVTLQGRAVELAEVTVEGDPTADRVGFNMRRGMGGGDYFTREDLDRRNVMDAADLVRQLPNMRIDGSEIHNRSPRANPTQAACPIATFLDGVLTPPDMVLNLPRHQIDAVEVYDAPGRVPTEFVRPETRCGAILFWTVQSRPREKE